MNRYLLLLLALITGLACSPRKPHATNSGGLVPETQDGPVALIKPPPSDAAFEVNPAVVDTVSVQQELVSGTNTAQVEVLVRGYLSDGCSDLHEVKQERSGNQISIKLMARRRTDMICTMAIRPYRFYVRLDKPLENGLYTLLLNNKTYPFQVYR